MPSYESVSISASLRPTNSVSINPNSMYHSHPAIDRPIPSQNHLLLLFISTSLVLTTLPSHPPTHQICPPPSLSINKSSPSSNVQSRNKTPPPKIHSLPFPPFSLPLSYPYPSHSRPPPPSPSTTNSNAQTQYSHLPLSQNRHPTTSQRLHPTILLK